MTFRVCFVCTGNICRSPTAEIVFRHLVSEADLDGAVDVDSAGTGSWHSGDDADPRAIRTMKAAGYEVPRHRARQFRPTDFAERDLIVALDAGHEWTLRRWARTEEEADKVRLLRSFDPAAAGGRDLDVPDPYSGASSFPHVLGLIEAACRGLLDDVRTSLPAR